MPQARPIHATEIKVDAVQMPRLLRRLMRAVLLALHDSRRRAAQRAIADYLVHK